MESSETPRGLLAWFAANHVAANLLMIFLLATGVLSLFIMKVEVFPEIDPDVILVTVPYPGASPSEVEESICTLLGHPEVCPDGKPIPRGKCCRKRLKVINNIVVSLRELHPGEKGKIAYIKPGSHSNLHQLMSIGLQPGIVVSVHRVNPAFCIKFEETELAIDEELASNIFVWKIDS